MASPSSSADEGEIVERQSAGPYKAKTSAATSSVRPDDGGDRFNVDRRNRISRGRSPRSPDRLSGGSYPYRNGSGNASPPRGQKRPRDDRDGRDSRWPASRERGDRDRYDYDDGPRRRDGRLPDWDRYEREDRSDRGDRGGRGGRGGSDRDRDRDRDVLSYDDDGGRYNRNATRKRQRTRSRSPPPSHPSSFRGNGNGYGNRGRDERDRRDDTFRDRDFDRNRDRNSHRNDRDRNPDRNWERDRGSRYSDRGTTPNHDRHAGGSRKEDRHAPTQEPPDSAPAPAPVPAPVPQEDWVEQAPIDEEAEIQRRRQRRLEILQKSRASTPIVALSNAASTPGDTASPASPSVASPRDPNDTAESVNLANDQDFMNMLGKQNTRGSADANANNAEDGPSAADYDPTVDMEEDERRDKLQHGGTVAGLHGATRRASLLAAVDARDVQAAQAAAEEESKADKDAANGADDEDNEDDEDDMFAEDFVEKKYEASNDDDVVAGNEGALAVGAALPAAAANGGGLLDGDDMQGYYKIRRGEILDGRYQIQSALGKGMFSGVARAWDITSPDKRREVAIKILRNNDALRKGGYTEIAILQKLNEADPGHKKHIVQFERAFDFRGHLCMAFENLSMNLREVLKKFGNNVGINLQGVRIYAYQIFVALAHMRRCSIIHADLKPDNILVNDNRSTLKICDLGTAIDRADAATAQTEVTPYLVSRFYRAPEIVLGMPYDYAVDMWSIGCTLYELYTGKILFTGESNNQMLRAIMEIRGKISAKLYRRGQLWPQHFDDNGGFLSQERDKFQGKTTIKTLPVIKPARDLRTRLQAASTGMSEAESKDLQLFHDLLDRCLNLNPDKRILPSDALRHPFFTARAGQK
ncbi:serine/threonineeeee-protein kinase PRP4 [Sporothrix schenckii 1099-18]|uniref:non-specific serine/threonine protein kinase n=1 Tax=Sporothrix schenckii 1099-18 TaxID=1397361 RepID=A0A0F2MAU9_SPOSC|nr:serine/threonineeeee-protein kinase PRP4 [Sporothrix schenckii 1099-18]KJR86209.1 serine/threonineeeee-protein kinase PRP4 [Sporothrix schenckii 1099-18]